MANAALIFKGSIQDYYGQPAAPANPPSGQARAYYNSVTDLFHIIDSTGADILVAGSGAVAFSGVTAGTSAAALVIGTGGSLTTSGSGTITATSMLFSGLTSATNSTAAMIVGTGASLTVSGSGTINATSLGGSAAANYATLASPTFTGTVTLPSGTISSGFALPTSASFPMTSQQVGSYMSYGGGIAGFIEEIFACATVTVAAATAVPMDGYWSAAPITGGTTGTIAAGGLNSFINQGTALLTTTAVSGQGIALYKGGGANGSAPLGILGANTLWQIDIWLKVAPTITNYAFRCGYVVSGQQVSDPPSGGSYFTYDTADASANSTIQFVTRNASTSTYTNTTVTPTASHIYHFRIYSTTAGTLIWQIGDNNAALSSPSAGVTSNVDTTHACEPLFSQVLPRTTAAVTVEVDRYSYIAVTGRV